MKDDGQGLSRRRGPRGRETSTPDSPMAIALIGEGVRMIGQARIHFHRGDLGVAAHAERKVRLPCLGWPATKVLPTVVPAASVLRRSLIKYITDAGGPF